MFTLMLSGIMGVALMLGLGLTDTSAWGWAVFFGIILTLACNTVAGLHFKKRIQAIAGEMNVPLQTLQKQVQEKANAWRFRPPGSPKQAQIEMQKMQHAAIEKALSLSKAFEPYYKWVPLLKRQVATQRMQLHYQDRNFAEVDRLLPKCLFMDPVTMAMGLARKYANKDPKLDEFFEKNVRKLRYGQGAVLYGLYAWIAVKRDDLDAALNVLLRATRKMENETLKRNIEVLQNNKPKQFSLAGLGDEWYALGLEEPRIKMQRAPQRPF